MSQYHLNYLEQLEAESIQIFREVAAQFEKPALLFSGGKDSIVMVHLAKKAFAPGKIPFPLVHVDTGHNFPEALEFRDWLANQVGATLVVRKVEDTIKQRSLTEPKGKFPSRNWLQTYTLLDTIEEFAFDACIGGARRDEEKARAKERIFSVRDEFGQWNPKLQRPELWNIYNRSEKIDLPSIYFAHDREVIEHEGQLVAMSEHVQTTAEDKIITKRVRYRTVGDMTCTAAVESTASNLDEVIEEIIATRISERGETRIDDRVTEAAMEDRKKNGYF
jgi:sulfate adenylyltransferase subunit 2